jgi:hypothetical protein
VLPLEEPVGVGVGEDEHAANITAARPSEATICDFFTTSNFHCREQVTPAYSRILAMFHYLV